MRPRALVIAIVRAAIHLLALAGLFTGAAAAQTIVVTTPPPGSQTPLPSTEVEGFVIDPLESVDQVFFRTRYTDGTLCPPIANDGAYTDRSISPGTLIYKVCEQGSSTACSSEETINY